ncbi:DMT family transporter [Pararoseomonas indoligenes]|uniref:DMT family transporter n=1 Tax=Roseomonas indoligenes TaxID=2820811 RepID=A0A940MWI3_9PROT|nr:DMT family transporter [Pararoseomonas indoligenes]MBP0494704.1 DMT family transporter [Pararoseomonas indoligenes]
MSPVLSGLLLQFTAIALFVGLDTVTKLLTVDYPVPQIVFMRFLFHTLLVAAALRLATGRLPWRSRAPGLEAVRSLCLLVANGLVVLAFYYIPLADAAAVTFASPLFTAGLAALLLGEVVGPRRWLGIGIGLVGVMIALRPPFLTGEMPHPALFLPLGTAAFFGAYQILTRKLSEVDSPSTIILHTGLAAGAVSGLVQPFVWQDPTGWAWGLMALAGVFGLSGHYLLVLAYSRAPASILAPMTYTQLIWATLSSAIVFGDMPDGWMLLGAGVIATGGIITSLPARRRPG